MIITQPGREPVTVGDSAPPAFRFVRGDANSSDKIDLADGAKILNFLFLGGGAPECDDAADANDSSSIDIADAVKIFDWLFKGGSAPPDPGPSKPDYFAEDCNIDPTPVNGLGCDRQSRLCQD